MVREILYSYFVKPLNITLWSNVYGVARTLLAIGTLLTLIFNHTDILFIQGVGVSPPVCNDITWLSLFCIFKNDLELARWISVVILVLVASGWRPAITGMLHFWVSYSLNSSALILDGGDSVTAVLTLLLLPICLTDNRKWHWVNEENKIQIGPFYEVKKWIAFTTYLIIQIQVSYIYLDAATEKFRVNEWLDGTGVYYWVFNSYMGADDWLKSIMIFFVSNRFVVTTLTWGAIIIELTLGLGLFINYKFRSTLLILGFFLHFLFAILFGLIPFSLAMSAALILYLRSPDNYFYFWYPKKIKNITIANT